MHSVCVTITKIMYFKTIVKEKQYGTVQAGIY